MSDVPTHTDVLALRHGSIRAFEQFAIGLFASQPEVRCIVLAVSQYFADEAGDALHEGVVVFDTDAPTWPHVCPEETAEVPRRAERCGRCGDSDRLSFIHLDSNSDAVAAWSALCTEWGGGEGESSRMDPVLIARPGAEGAVSFEWVHEVVRPWLDDNFAAEARDAEQWDETPLPPAPEPVRPDWTSSERGLFEAVLASPRDDAPRKVLVDHWLERGDVRGDYGALSFSHQVDAASRRRRFDLELEHGRRWLGPLQPAVTLGAMTFGRGPFAQRVGVFVGPRADARALEDVPDWALVEAIHLTGERPLFSRHQRGLVELSGMTGPWLEQLERSGLVAPIEVLGVEGDVPAPDQWAATLAGVSRLRIERQHAAVSEAWAKLPWWSRLREVEVWFDLRDDAVHGWHDERGSRALETLWPQLPVGARLTVGYHLANGRRAGTVAQMRQGIRAVELVDLLFGGGQARENADRSLERRTQPAPTTPAPTTPAPTPPAIAQPQPGALSRFVSRLFGKK